MVLLIHFLKQSRRWYLGDLQISVNICVQGLVFKSTTLKLPIKKCRQELERSSFVSSDREGGLIASLLVLDLSCNDTTYGEWLHSMNRVFMISQWSTCLHNINVALTCNFLNRNVLLQSLQRFWAGDQWKGKRHTQDARQLREVIAVMKRRRKLMSSPKLREFDMLFCLQLRKGSKS